MSTAVGSTTTTDYLSTIGSAKEAGKSLAADMDSFLNLLVAQLKNQDPLDPMETAEFTNQLVQFANVEQNIATNDNLENLLLMTNSSLAMQATSYMGKTIQAESVHLPLQDGYGKFSYVLGAEAATCTITIADAESGRIVTSVTGDTSVGRHVLDWDGTDAAGVKWKDGAYRLTVTATDLNGEAIDAYTTVFGKVTGVANDGSDVAVSLGDVIVYTSNILAVHEDGELQNPNTQVNMGSDDKSADTGTTGTSDGSEV